MNKDFIAHLTESEKETLAQQFGKDRQGFIDAYTQAKTTHLAQDSQ